MTRIDTQLERRSDRCVAFATGAFNVRDLGGLSVVGGGHVRRGCVYRADGLHRLPVAEVERLGAMGVRTVVDLRTTGELAKDASVRAEGILVVHLPVLREVWTDGVLSPGETADPSAFLVGRYLEMLDQGQEAIAGVFELLASATRRPLAFHCSAGKDRTGVLAALVLALLGVADDDIAEDYAASADAMDSLAGWMRENRPEAAASMALEPSAIASCPVEVMHLVLHDIRSRWGSISGYLSSIGVSDETMSSVRSALTEPGAATGEKPRA